jgi:hypothetical protein
MKNLIILFLLIDLTCYAQETKIGISYEYLYSPQFDKAIQTYNFSRPFLNEKQPLFINGIQAEVKHSFNSKKNIQHGFSIGYSNFRSQAENINFINTLQLHQIQLGYLVHFDNTKKFVRFYEEIQVNCVVGGLFKKINYEAAQIEDNRVKALGIGGEIEALIGYKLKKYTRFSPFISICYSPYHYIPNSETLLNDTKNLIINPWVNYFKMNLGISFKISKMKSN